MVTLMLVASDDDFDPTDEVLRKADELVIRHPQAAQTVGIIVENYIDCLQSLLAGAVGGGQVDDWDGLGDAS